MLKRGKSFFQNNGADGAEKRHSVVSPGVTVRGEIQGEESIQVWGWIEGKISLTGDAIIEAGAEVRADISATRIVVGGSVQGNLAASDKVEILPTGKVRGEIVTKVLLVHEGASLSGGVQAGSPSQSKVAELEEEVNREEARAFWRQEQSG
jgi:cytoskeletal protein CcmA (bactofilin family)